ncbi:MAG: XdhC family protein [Bacteroidetes bacterium]|nr:XdhC family protein [Bacteroidota bacterium]
MQSIYSKIEELRSSNTPAALCIVTDTSGSTPRKQGSKMIVFADGSVFGTIGGGSIEKEVVEKALKLIPTGKTEKNNFNLGADLGMHCGGSMEVYIEPLNSSRKLYIFGGGHIGRALSGFAKELDFAVTVIDPRPEVFTGKEFEACNCVCEDYFKAIEKQEFDPECYMVIVTPKHVFDEDILARVARRPHAYVGMIGSKRKVALLKTRFLEENLLTEQELSSIDMPIGLSMLVETPQEIAISILAKLIDVRNSRNNS